MWSVVTAKFRDMEEKIRKGRIRRRRKEVVGCAQNVVGKKKFLVQFEGGQRRDMIYTLILYICSKYQT